MKINSIYRDVANLHVTCIDRGFLSTLGPKVLAVVYEAIDSDPGSVLLVDYKNEEIVGFVAAGKGMKSVYYRLFLHLPRLLIPLLPSLLNPKKIMKIIEVVIYSTSHSKPPGYPCAELYSIAVAESSRGKGIAGNLYKTLMERFRGNNIDSFSIVVGDSLLDAKRFYKKMGARAVDKIELHQNELSTIYVQKII